MANGFEHASTHLDTHFGPFEFHCFSWGKHEEDNILCLRKDSIGNPALMRVQSACYTAEIFRSLDCDCHEQLEESLRQIQENGGLFVYLLCDGRGAGLLNKVRGLALGDTKGLDTADAYKALGLAPDPRNYERVCDILTYFGIDAVRLLTNNPRKVLGLERGKIQVTRMPLEIPATHKSKPYLLTKKTKMGHLLDQFGKDRAT